MKKFVFTRFGINNFTAPWFKRRMEFVKYFFIKSIENNREKELFWVILINKDAPQSEKSELNEIILKSQVRENIYLIDVDYPFEENEIAYYFVRNHTLPNEQVLLSRCDADDIYKRNFLKEIDVFCLENCITNTTLITIPHGYLFLLNEKIVSQYIAECRSMNNFIITKDRDITIFDSPHHLFKEYFIKNNYEVIVCDQIKGGWFKTETPDNVDNLRDSNKYNNVFKYVNENRSFSIYSLSEKFGIDKIDDFYNSYYSLPTCNESLIYRGGVMLRARQLYKEWQLIKKLFIDDVIKKYDYQNYSKLMKHVQKVYNLNALEAIKQIYCQNQYTFFVNASTLNEYVQHLKNDLNQYIIIVTSHDDASKYWSCFDKSSLNLNSDLNGKFRYNYLALIDVRNNYKFEKTSHDGLHLEYKIGDIVFNIVSDRTLKSSCIVNRENENIEYSIGRRGLNFVVYNYQFHDIVDTFNVDFWGDRDLNIIRKF